MIKSGQRYRHYKSTGGDNHTYEIVGIAKHSESEEIVVVYKPLFDAEKTWLGEYQFAVRPLTMWNEEVERNGKRVKRFTLIA